jgi:tol-pal system protein YbgF
MKRSTIILTPGKPVRMRHWLPVLTAIVAVVPAPASAQTDTAGANRGVVQLLNQVEALNGDLNRLRGQIELLTNEISNAQKRQRDMYVDLDTRLRRIEQQSAAMKKDQEAATALEARVRKLEQAAAERAAIPAPVPAPAVAAVAPPAATLPANANPDDPTSIQRAYETAFSHYRVGDYPAAVRSFEAFLRAYPKHPLAANAQYWIGESHLQMRDFQAAIDAQRRLLAAYPDSNKVPDALLIIGTAESSLGAATAARTTFEDLIARYPASDSAEKARVRLSRLQ